MGMLKKQMTATLLAFCMAILSAWSQAPKTTRILFVLDASGSMYERMDKDTRMNVAKKLLTRMVDSLAYVPNVEVALRVYGHLKYRDCQDTKLEVGFDKFNHNEIKEKIKTLKPNGTTLIAYSLQQAAYDFAPDANARNIIVLITDGIEECQGDPCAVSLALQKQGVILKPFIIGVGGDDRFQKQFECVGKYFEANTEDVFQKVLGVVISQAINNTTSQVNLLDANGRALETDVPMSFYDSKTKRLLETFVHTMNDKGLPDTLYLDPSHTYDIIIHTIPKVEVKGVNLIPGKHNIIAANAGQGDLKLEIDGLSNYNRLQALIKMQGSTEILNVQDFNSKERYLNGLYDVEILSLPRIFKDSVQITQSHTTTLKIPQPGKIFLQSNRTDVIGGIYRLKEGKLDWVCNVITQAGKQIIILQPGYYQLVVRRVNEKNTVSTKKIDFEIISGRVTDVNSQ
jgi:Ca-activated chloride channel family protein